ncbi:hypothetical protein RN001_013679 [Aquatica leii]|uniref:Ig-like domain-containing protein n=1 Tax=Aquatica leii TaxID=1421715 RepID=A0AAN7SE19_9COLE|nr:hypothetical protein RN001_013679 [Aquatica leii]
MMYGIYRFPAVLVLLLVFEIHNGIGVKINKLQVPKVIQHGAPVVLDCDFALEDFDDVDDKNVGLVVKWYFNENDHKPVYQWIPGSSKRPQELGVLRGRLNLEYAASVDANSVHRALHILKSSPDLSGDYTCHVATFQSEDRKTKSMLVFVPEKNLMLKKLAGEDEGFIRVLCTADGVFPRPTMTLRSQERDIAETKVVVRERGQLFDISASTSLPALNDPEEFSCELRIPQANYTVRRETVFYPGDSANSVAKCKWLTLVSWLFLIWTNTVRENAGFC